MTEPTVPGEDPRPRFRVLYQERGEARTWGWYTTRAGAERAAADIVARGFPARVEEWSRATPMPEEMREGPL